MSLVGPRPCLAYEYDQYLPWQKQRFESVPGLTGLWQVSGKNKTTFVEMIQFDIKYAKNKTLWRDLKIILMTVPALVTQILETRQAGKASSNSVHRKPDYPICATQARFLARATFVGVVQARDGDSVWLRKESELSL
jgi:hypothetical protein